MVRTLSFDSDVNDYIQIMRIVDNDDEYAAYEMVVQVTKVTEKAIQVRCGNSNIKVWFPKAALKITAKANTVVAATIKDWFDIDEWYIKAEKRNAIKVW